MDGSTVFARWRQCAPHITQSLGPTESIYPKRYLDRFVRFRTAHGRMYLYFTIGCPFPLKVAPSHGDLDPHLIHVSWAHPSPHPKRHLYRFSHFRRLSAMSYENKSLAVAEMGGHGHNRHGRKEGAAVPLSRTAGTTSNTMWPVPRSTSVPSGVFIHPAVWPQ